MLLALALALAACASGTSARGEAVQDADESKVRSCTYLRDLSRKEGWWYGVIGRVSGEYSQQGLEKARADVRREAKELGATHVVWLPKTDNSQSTLARAKAYRC